MNDLGLSQLVKQPTHIEPTPTLLDLIITNMTERGAGTTLKLGGKRFTGSKVTPTQN